MKDDMLKAIKKAMQGEKDSVTLYENAAAHAGGAEVEEFFASRAEEERRHFNHLLRYYQEISGDLLPSQPAAELSEVREAASIFSESLIRRIGGDQYLFSAISTALLLEKDSFEHYSATAHAAGQPELKKFFELLAQWEKKHYDELLAIQQAAEHYYWEINSFEPF
ncbi:MAG: ferritin family protein [Candidatus Cloacimonetes bacterium]|nr:ferritin family protein [Candidatus Cloacimonadota bacterium]MDY0366967.1 ferritin family protein [Candidatus Syntrophosphaera sp.]